MAMLLSSFRRTAADYRLAYTTLLAHVAAMASLLWYLGVEPHYQAASLYADWSFSAGGGGAISGISAMPSLHVAVAVIIACVTWQRGGVCRKIGLAYAVTIYIGSIQLGWHYATDGIIGGAIALLFWKASAYLTDWSLSRRLDPAEVVRGI